MEAKEMNHEIWKTCASCGEEYDARLADHICNDNQEKE